jgi:hypothetical protein
MIDALQFRTAMSDLKKIVLDEIFCLISRMSVWINFICIRIATTCKLVYRNKSVRLLMKLFDPIRDFWESRIILNRVWSRRNSPFLFRCVCSMTCIHIVFVDNKRISFAIFLTSKFNGRFGGVWIGVKDSPFVWQLLDTFVSITLEMVCDDRCTLISYRHVRSQKMVLHEIFCWISRMSEGINFICIRIAITCLLVHTNKSVKLLVKLFDIIWGFWEKRDNFESSFVKKRFGKCISTCLNDSSHQHCICGLQTQPL